MSGPYVVVVETPMGGAFIMARGLTSEFPNAKQYTNLRAAKQAAAAHHGAKVYTIDGYTRDASPVWVQS